MPDPRTPPTPAPGLTVVATIARSAEIAGHWVAIGLWPERSLLGTCETEAAALAMARDYAASVVPLLLACRADTPTAANVWH